MFFFYQFDKWKGTMTIKPRSLRLLWLQKDVFCGRAYCWSSLHRRQHAFSKSAVSSLSPLCKELPAAGAHTTPLFPLPQKVFVAAANSSPCSECFISINLSSVHKKSEVSTIITPSLQRKAQKHGEVK